MTNENQRRGALSGTVVQQTLRYSPLDSSEIIVDDNRKAELDKLNTTGTDFVSISVEDDFVKASAVIKEAIDEYNAQIKKYYSYSDSANSDIIQTPKKKGDKTSVTAKSGVVNITDLGSKDSIKIVTEDRQNSITTHNSSKIKELKTADLQNLIPTGTAVGKGKMTGYTNAKYSAEITFNSANRKEFGDILKEKITQRINGNQKFEHYSQVVKDKLIEMNCAILTAQIDSSQQTPHTSLQGKISTTLDVVNVTGEYTFTRKPKKESIVLKKVSPTATNSSAQAQVKEKLKTEVSNAIKEASLPQTELKAIAQEHLAKLQAEVESLCKAEYIQRSFPGLYAVEHLSLHQHESQYLTKAQKDQLFSVDIGDQTIADVLSNFKESDHETLTARINDGKTNDKITNFQLFEILKNQPAWTNLDRDEQSTVEIKLSGKMLSSDQNDIFTEFEAMLDQIAIFDVGDPGWKRSKGIVPFDTGQGKSFLVDDIIYKYNGLIKDFFDENDSVRGFFEKQEFAKTANSLEIHQKEKEIKDLEKALSKRELAPKRLKEKQDTIRKERKELKKLKAPKTTSNTLEDKIKDLESQAKEAAGDNAENLKQIQKQLEVFKQVAEDPKRYLKQYQLYAKGFEIININLANKEDLKTKSESKDSLHGQVIIIDEAIFINEYIAQIRSLVDKGAKVIAVGATLSLPKTLEDIERKTDKIPNERELQNCRDELKQLQESKSITDILSKDAIDERKKDLSAQITGLENTQKNKKDFEPYARKTKMAEGNLSDIKERRNKAQGRLRHDKTTVTKSNLKEVNQSNWTRLVTEASAGEGKTQNIIPGLKLSFGKDATIAQLQKAANNTGELVVANFIEKGQHKIAFIQKGKTEVEIFDTNSEAFKEAFNKIPEQERESAEKIVDANYQLQIVSSKNNKLVVANFIEKVERGEKKELVEIHRIALIQPKDGDKEQKIEFFDAGSDTFKEAIKKISKEHPEQAKQAVMVYAGDYEFVVGGDYSNLSVLKEGDTQNIFLSKQEHVNIDLLKQMIGRDRSGRDDITRNIVCSQNSQANTTSKKDFIQQSTQNVKKKEISGLIGNLEKKILKRTALTDPEIQSSAEKDNDKSRQVKEITILSASQKRQIVSGELRLNPDLVTQKGQLKLVSGVDSKDFFTKTSTISDLDLDEVKTDSDVISTKSPRPTDCNLTDISDINWNEEDHASSTYKLNRDLRSYLFWQNIEKGDFKFENYEHITKKPQDYGLDEEFAESVKGLGDKPVQDEEFIELAFRISHCEKTTFAKRRDALLEVKATKLESLQTKWDKLKTEELSEKLEELQSAINEKLVTAHDELTAEGNNSKSEAAQKLKTIESKIIGEKTVSQLLEDYKKQIEDLDPDFNEKLRDSLQNNVSTTQDLVQTVKELALKIEQKGVTDVNLAKSELAGIITELKASEDEKTALKTENTALKADLESKSDKLATSEQQNQESLRRLADSAVREKQQAGRIKQLEQEKAEQAQQHAAQVATDLSSKGETEQQLHGDLTRQADQIAELKAADTTTQAKITELTSDLKATKDREVELRDENTKAKRKNEEFRQNVFNKYSKSNLLSTRVDRLNKEKEELQKSKDADKTNSDERIAELEADFSKAVDQVMKLSQQNRNLTQRNQNLTTDNETLAQTLTAVKNSNSQEKGLSSHKAQYDQNAALEKQRAGLEKAAQDAQTKLQQEHEAALSALRAEKDAALTKALGAEREKSKALEQKLKEEQEKNRQPKKDAPKLDLAAATTSTTTDTPGSPRSITEFLHSPAKTMATPIVANAMNTSSQTQFVSEEDKKAAQQATRISELEAALAAKQDAPKPEPTTTTNAGTSTEATLSVAEQDKDAKIKALQQQVAALRKAEATKTANRIVGAEVAGENIFHKRRTESAQQSATIAAATETQRKHTTELAAAEKTSITANNRATASETDKATLEKQLAEEQNKPKAKQVATTSTGTSTTESEAKEKIEQDAKKEETSKELAEAKAKHAAEIKTLQAQNAILQADLKSAGTSTEASEDRKKEEQSTQAEETRRRKTVSTKATDTLDKYMAERRSSSTRTSSAGDLEGDLKSGDENFAKTLAKETSEKSKELSAQLEKQAATIQTLQTEAAAATKTQKQQDDKLAEANKIASTAETDKAASTKTAEEQALEIIALKEKLTAATGTQQSTSTASSSSTSSGTKTSEEAASGVTTPTQTHQSTEEAAKFVASIPGKSEVEQKLEEEITRLQNTNSVSTSQLETSKKEVEKASEESAEKDTTIAQLRADLEEEQRKNATSAKTQTTNQSTSTSAETGGVFPESSRKRQRSGEVRRAASTSTTAESKKEGHWFDEDSRSKKIIRVMNKLYAVKDKLDDTGFADFIGKIDSLQVGNTFDNLKAINKTFEGKNFSLTMADISVLDKMDDIDRKLVLDQSTDKDKNEKHRFDLVAIWDEYKKSQSADKISKILTSSSTKLSETDKVTFETQHEEGNKEEIYNSDSYPISPYEGISPSPTLVKVYTATKLTVGIERSPSEAFNLEGRGIGTSPALAG